MVILARTGGPPLEVYANLIATERTNDDQKVDRDYEVSVYEMPEKGGYVVAVKYITRWKTEASTDRVILCPAPCDLVKVLTEFNPLADVIGYPGGKQFEEKQKRLMTSLKLQWDALVGRLLAKIPATATKK